MKSDAWHHRSDAITSAAAFVGISIAIAGGPGYESADDFAALFAAGIITINAFMVLKPALYELIDTAPDPELLLQIREIAESVEDVLGTDQGYVRKVGFDYYVDLDILCNPEYSIRRGHDIAHNVVDAIQQKLPQITKVLIHVEPVDDYGWRRRKNENE
jgi:cation diffusion facilitator family transporter